MKKIMLFICFAILLTGCSASFTYDFQADKINSKIGIVFTNTDYINYQNSIWSEGVNNKIDPSEMIENYYDSSEILAVENSNSFYNKTAHKIEGDNHEFLYDYDFSYEDFENNYILKNCFDYFITIEDDDFYYYYVKGNFKCNYDENMYIKVKGDRVYKTNSTDIKNDIHSWNVKEKDNDIHFMISKNEIVRSKPKHTVVIIGIIVVVILSIITLGLYFIAKNHE